MQDILVGVDLIRRAERLDPLDDRMVRDRVARGEWVRVSPGVFAVSKQWATMSARDRHRHVIRERVRHAEGVVVLSHHSAAAEQDIRLLRPWPELVHISRRPARGGRSTGGFRRHPRDMDRVATQPFGRHRITTPAQTAVDLARALPHIEGVAAVDQAVTVARRGGALTTLREIEDVWRSIPVAARGRMHAWRAIAASDPLAANVRESQARITMLVLGFPRPRLQERRVLRSGRLVFGDFYFPEHDHWAELDGRGKYTSPEFGADRDPRQIVIDEKNRENEIRREVRGFSRFEPVDVDHAARLYDILTRDGLPSSLPRP